MKQKNLSIIPIGNIDPADRLFQISDSTVIDSLTASIKNIGLINPVILQPIGERRYRVVTGFRRLSAIINLGIAEMPAFVVEDRSTELKLFDLALQDNLAIRRFNPIEVSVVIHKLEAAFYLTKAEIIGKYLPMLGYGRNPKVYELYAPLHLLEQAWHPPIIDDLISLDIASMVSAVDEEDRSAFLSVIKALRLGKNRQHEFWTLLNDLCRLRQVGLHQLLREDDFAAILSDTRHTPSQNCERFRSLLIKKRYPRYQQIQEQFEKLVTESGLPSEMQILAPSFFEGDKFQINFAFQGEDEYRDKLGKLSTLLSRGVIKKLVELT
jgi:hypothetical protein